MTTDIGDVERRLNDRIDVLTEEVNILKHQRKAAGWELNVISKQIATLADMLPKFLERVGSDKVA